MVRTRRSRGALLSEDSSDDDAEVVAETKTGETLRPIEDVVDEIDGVVDDAVLGIAQFSRINSQAHLALVIWTFCYCRVYQGG